MMLSVRFGSIMTASKTSREAGAHMKNLDTLRRRKKQPRDKSKNMSQLKSKMEYLLRILNKLECRDAVSAHSLVDEFGCSERTAYRYIQTLQDVFPIHYDRQKVSYAFLEGYSLRRPDMTVEETIAFAIAKKALGNMGEEMEQCLSSIERKLSSTRRELPKHIILSGDHPSPAISGYLGALYDAILNYQRVQLDYRALYSNEESHRKIEPYYLFIQDNLWHLRAYCCEKKELRTFAVDRILSLTTLDEHFIPKPDSSPIDDFSGAFGSVVDGDPVEVVLKFDAEIKPYVQRKKWHHSQREKELKDGRLEIKFQVNGFEGIKHWIYRWLPHVEITGPRSLKNICSEELKRSLEKI